MDVHVLAAPIPADGAPRRGRPPKQAQPLRVEQNATPARRHLLASIARQAERRAEIERRSLQAQAAQLRNRMIVKLTSMRHRRGDALLAINKLVNDLARLEVVETRLVRLDRR